MDEQFLFDDFFVDESDPGIEIMILVRGRHVPIRIRPLSTADHIAVQAAAVSRRFIPEGQVVIDRIDEAKANSLLIAKSIVSWPFTFRDGSPVPVMPDGVIFLSLPRAGKRLAPRILAGWVTIGSGMRVQPVCRRWPEPLP